MNKKYELTDETIEILGHVLHRIKALTKFGWVNKGELGGYIEKEENLSQYCKCWISDKAMVYEDARVYGNAHVSDKAMVYEDAEISDNAHVFGKANICGHSKVYGNARVCDDAIVCSNAQVFGNALIYATAKVSDNVRVFGYSHIGGDSDIYEETVITVKKNVNESHDLLFEKIGVVTEHHYSLIESDAITRMISDKNMTKDEMEKNFKRIVSHSSNDNDIEYEKWLDSISR